VKNENVTTPKGLQSILQAAANKLFVVEEDSIEWVRAVVTTVNCGNSLIRTIQRDKPAKKVVK
jgi:hypothetical protein